MGGTHGRPGVPHLDLGTGAGAIAVGVPSDYAQQRAITISPTSTYEAPAIQDTSWKEYPLVAIAEAQAEAGDLKGAFQTGGTIQHQSNRDEALLLIPRSQVRTGQLRGAFQTASNIQGDFDKEIAIRNISFGQTRAGDLSGALAWSLNKKSMPIKAGALMGVAMGVLEEMEGKQGQTSLPKWEW